MSLVDHRATDRRPTDRRSTDRRGAVRLGLAGVLGAGAALLVACGSGTSPLIPAGNAGPLQSDFDAVQSSVQSGDCTQTKTEVQKTRQDLAALPGTVNPQLLETLTTGVQTLAARAATECRQNAGSSTTTTGQTSIPSQTTTTTTTNTNTNTNTTPANTTTDTTPVDTNTTPPPTNTDTAPTDTNTAPATTVPGSGGLPSGVGGTQAPGATTPSSDPSGGTPGGGN
ncbi:MAG TPA: hypothetical protein VG165_18105 [Solirubrobacteraceae bacterium]|jgi:cell division septation protein DedD|nr:hypothetical protein [Solirubrobacteraceae bacterium]